jgi:hypothetical protein
MTSSSLKLDQFTLPIYVHPWYEALKEQENTTRCESPSLRKLSKEPPGLKSIEWAAGLYEGEGYLTRYKNRWELAVKMTDLDVLQDFYDIVRCGVLRGPYHDPSQKKHHKPYYRWRTYNKQEIFDLVAEFYPLMCERRRAKFDEFLTHYQNGY